MLWFIEFVIVLRLWGVCDVIMVVISYFSFALFIEMDNWTFNSLNDNLPFKQVVLAPLDEKPDILTIDRTTSLKNSWADRFYIEKLDTDMAQRTAEIR